MAAYSIAAGVLLIAIGLWGYLGAAAEDRSMTALIPAFIGIALALLGLLALKENVRKHAMHAAALIALLGFLASGGRLLSKLIAEGSVGGRGAVALGGTALVCAVFVGLCVQSFVAARRARAQRGE